MIVCIEGRYYMALDEFQPLVNVVHYRESLNEVLQYAFMTESFDATAGTHFYRVMRLMQLLDFTSAQILMLPDKELEKVFSR